MKAPERSRQLYERACRAIPGGVSSPVRAFRAVGGTPLFIARGNGAQVFEVDLADATCDVEFEGDGRFAVGVVDVSAAVALEAVDIDGP